MPRDPDGLDGDSATPFPTAVGDTPIPATTKAPTAIDGYDSPHLLAERLLPQQLTEHELLQLRWTEALGPLQVVEIV